MSNNLIHGDCYKLYSRIEKKSVDLIFTDIPFGLFGKDSSLKMEWDTPQDLYELKTMFDYVLKPDGQILMFADLKLLMNLIEVFTDWFKFRFYFVWVKSGMPVNTLQPINNTEFILCFKREGVKTSSLVWNPYEIGAKGEPYTKHNYSQDIPTRRLKKSPLNKNIDGKRYPKATLYAPSRPNMEKWERELTSNPFQKPETLCRKLIRGFTNEGDIVFDPFAGSGSILASAYKEGRESTGFEIDSVFYSQATK